LNYLQKLIKSIGKSEHWCCDHKTSRNITFVYGFTDRIIPSAIPSAILMINKARHCTEISLWILRWFHRDVKRWIGHVTVRICCFESLDDSVGKITQKTSTSANHIFLIQHIPSVIPSINTDRMCSSVYTGEMTNGKKSVSNGDLKVPTEVGRR